MIGGYCGCTVPVPPRSHTCFEVFDVSHRRRQLLLCNTQLATSFFACLLGTSKLLLSSRELTLCLLQRRLGNSELLRSLRHLTTKLLEFGTSLTLSSRRSGTGSDKLLLRRLCCSLELLEFGAQRLLTLFACDCYSFKFGHASLPSRNICDSWVCNSWHEVGFGIPDSSCSTCDADASVCVASWPSDASSCSLVLVSAVRVSSNDASATASFSAVSDTSPRSFSSSAPASP